MEVEGGKGGGREEGEGKGRGREGGKEGGMERGRVKGGREVGKEVGLALFACTHSDIHTGFHDEIPRKEPQKRSGQEGTKHHLGHEIISQVLKTNEYVSFIDSLQQFFQCPPDLLILIGQLLHLTLQVRLLRRELEAGGVPLQLGLEHAFPLQVSTGGFLKNRHSYYK